MGPTYTHGHHGAAKLEHKLSTSYSNLTRALEALAKDDSAIRSPSAANFAAVAAKLPLQLSQKASPLSATAVMPLQPSQNVVTAHAGPQAPVVEARKTAEASTSLIAGSGSLCLGCGKAGWTGRSFTALGGKWHEQCWRCAGCLQLLQGAYNTGKDDNMPYHPECFKAAFGKRCAACKALLQGTFVEIEGLPMHADCFRCKLCEQRIEDSYNTSKQDHGHYHSSCYKQKFGKHCSACGAVIASAAVAVGGVTLHSTCFKCAACQRPITGQYNTDTATGKHYDPQCYQEQFGKRCSACKKILEGKYCTVEGVSLHHACFKCQACNLPITGSYSTSKDDSCHYHSQCFKERFGKRCAACNELLEGSYTVVAGRNLHHTCHTCTACRAQIQEPKFNLEGAESYHSPCHREKFDPRCDVCAELLPLVKGHIEFCVASFWKQKYCRKHEQSSTPRCCSCNRLKANGQEWLTLSDKRMVCQDCSRTVVHDTEEAQPLYDEVLAFFAKLGLPLREKPPMMLVDGPTLQDQKQDEDDGMNGTDSSSEEPVFHTRGLCMSKVWGRMSHVAGTQRGYSQLHKQPSLDATLRPADLSARRVEVTAILVMYGLPRLLTGSILAHECMHAWFVLNYIDCSGKALNEGLSQLMALMWIEAQTGQEGWEERLASYFANQIRTHPSDTYGGGFQAALGAFQDHGLRASLLHVKKTGVLPPEKAAHSEQEQAQKQRIKAALQSDAEQQKP